MSNSAIELGLNYLEATDEPIAKRFVEVATASNFKLTKELARFKDQLVILDGNPTNLMAPSILYCGENALAANEFSFKQSLSFEPFPIIFSKTYQSITSSGYVNCIRDSRVMVEYIECDDAVIGQHFPVSYTRAMVPITNGQGAWFIAVYSFRRHLNQYPVGFSKAVQLQPDRNLGNTNLHMPDLLEASPKPDHLHSRSYSPT